MSEAVENSNRRMLRARDAMDRYYWPPLDIAALARIAYVSEGTSTPKRFGYQRCTAA